MVNPIGGVDAGTLRVEGIQKFFEGDDGEPVRAVDDVSFEVEPGEFYTLLGPSGCGKTTTLRSVAGLESITAGSIVLGDRVLSAPGRSIELPPHERGLGMVFQSYAIWPHMTVFENVAFPLEIRRAKLSKAEIRSRVEQALAAVELDGLEERMATALSGGQQQRLALARALVGEPRLLLLDEPLSNLDAKLRDAMRAELRDIQRRLGVTTLYVTHDQMEALSMSTRIAVMSGGKIVQEDTPEQIYRNPNSYFVAQFLGNRNFLRAERTNAPSASGMAEYVLPQAAGTKVRAPHPEGVGPGEPVTIAIRYEAASLLPSDEPTRDNVVPGVVGVVMFLGEAIQYHVNLPDGSELVVRANPSSRPFHPEDGVHVTLPSAECAVISQEHGVATLEPDRRAASVAER